MNTVLFFGQLADFTKAKELHFEALKDTNELIQELNKKYPSFANSSYTIAIDKKLIKENTILHPGETIALLPPFSGG